MGYSSTGRIWLSLKTLGKGPFENLAVFQHIRDPGRAAQIVLEHVKLTIGIPYEIGARDMAPDTLGRVETVALSAIGFAGENQVIRYDLVFENPAFVINVIDEQVDGDRSAA